MQPTLNHLLASPLTGVTLTLVSYQAALWVHQRTGNHPISNPLLLAVTMIVGFLTFTGTSYDTYFAGAKWVHFWLGPATVALAIPLYQHLPLVRSMLRPIVLGLLAGSFTAIATAVLVARYLGAHLDTQLSMAPKSVTTPIAMGIAERIGGIPSLTAAVVIITGIVGAISARHLLDALQVRDDAIRGFAMGISSHGIGTARAFQINEKTGAFSALAMGLNGILTALVLPLVAAWMR